MNKMVVLIFFLGRFAQFGAALFNKSSTTWQGLDDEEWGRNLINLLQTYPKLIKPPLTRMVPI